MWRRKIKKARKIDDLHQCAAYIDQSVEPGLRIRDARGTWRRDHFTHILTRRDEPLRAEPESKTGPALRLAAGAERVEAGSSEPILDLFENRERYVAQRAQVGGRSEERRVGTECVSTCRSRWSPYH